MSTYNEAPKFVIPGDAAPQIVLDMQQLQARVEASQLEESLDILSFRKPGLSELIEAIANDSPKEMTSVFDAGFTCSNKDVCSALHVAATYGSVACMAHLLRTEGASVNSRDKDGHTPLHMAAVEGSADTISKLIEGGADVTITTVDSRARLMSGGLAIDMTGGRTALHLAASHGHLEAVKVLFTTCPSLSQMQDHDGATPRDVAMRDGSRSRSESLSKNRIRIAELLDPNAEIPSLEELRRLADADNAKRRKRCDVAELAAKLAVKKAAEATSFPSDNGYNSEDVGLYELDESDFRSSLSPCLAEALVIKDEASRNSALREMCDEITPGVYAFQLFDFNSNSCSSSNNISNVNGNEDTIADVTTAATTTTATTTTTTATATTTMTASERKHFCNRILQELQAVEAWAGRSGWNLSRPNSMNRYGLVLKDVGLSAISKCLASVVVQPLVKAVWPEKDDVTSDLHAFTVRYRGGEDRRLDTHVDASDVTLNVCLGEQFKGGGVYFHSRRDGGSVDPMTLPHPNDCPHCLVTHGHEPGVALLHLGDHIHGAHNIDSGMRTNLVLWCRRQQP